MDIDLKRSVGQNESRCLVGQSSPTNQSGFYLMYSPLWVRKNILCIDEGNGIVVGRRQSKKQ
jgi:hypothetical protein